MLTLADKGGRGGLAKDDGTDKNAFKRAKTYSFTKSPNIFGNFGELLYLFGHSG